MLGLHQRKKLMGIMLVLIPITVVPLIVIGRRVRSLVARLSGPHCPTPAGLRERTLKTRSQTVQAFHLGGNCRANGYPQRSRG